MKETAIADRDKKARVTLEDVARAAGVSITTVDRVLNGRAPVSARLAQQVYDAARVLHYHGLPILRARAPAPRRRFRLGVALRRRHHAFYQQIEAELRLAAAAHTGAEIELAFYYQSNNSLAEAAAFVRDMGSRCDAVAIMAPDGPIVSDAVIELRQRNVFTFSILSDFALDARQAYIGVNNRQAGRTAGWGTAHTAARPGQIALIVGTDSYLAQEMRELGFRSYMRERRKDFEIVETLAVTESSDAVRVSTMHLLERYPDLVGIYVVSGGFEGALEALVAKGRERAVALVANEITPASRQGLMDGTISMVIATPVRQLAQQLINEAVSAVNNLGGELSRPEALPFNIFISENVS